MIYAPHTFELSLILDTDKFHKLKNKAYEKSRGHHKMFQDEDYPDKHIDTALADQGIKIEYHDSTYKKRVKLIVNPTAVLGGDDVVKLWKPNKGNLSKLLCQLEESIDEYFKSRYQLDDFNLARMDFTVNIDVGSKDNVAAYIKVLRRIGKVKGFKAKYKKGDTRINTDHSFDLEGKSNGVEFTAYDKLAQSKRKEAKGILRVEARLTKPKAIRKYTDETSVSKQIRCLSLNSRAIFLDTFIHIIPFGDYYKKPQAVRIIEDSVSNKKPREKMLRLLALIPEKKSLYLAQKEMKDRNIHKVMQRFAELHVSPVTIGKHQKVKCLKNLYSYLE